MPLPPIEAMARHKELVSLFQEQLADDLARLEAAAFGEIEPVIVNDPIGAVRQAIKDNDPQAIKAAALAGYEQGIYTVVRLAAGYDQAISDLADHLQTFGALANLNQRLFIEAILAAPEGRNDYMPALR